MWLLTRTHIVAKPPETALIADVEHISAGDGRPQLGRLPDPGLRHIQQSKYSRRAHAYIRYAAEADRLWPLDLSAPTGVVLDSQRSQFAVRIAFVGLNKRFVVGNPLVPQVGAALHAMQSGLHMFRLKIGCWPTIPLLRRRFPILLSLLPISPQSRRAPASPNVMTNEQILKSTLLFAVLGTAGACQDSEDAPETSEPAPASEASDEFRSASVENGLRLANSLTLANSLRFGNGLNLSNGLRLANGTELPESLHVSSEYALGEELMGLDEWSDVARRVVQCALPEGTSVEVDTPDGPVSFPGQVGLAPEWQTESCDVACQEWVSACLLALVNPTGTVVDIEISAHHPAVGGDPTYPYQEGAFYGNILSDDGGYAYSCWGDDPFAALRSDRTCAIPGRHCFIKSSGPCRRICDEVGDSYDGCKMRKRGWRRPQWQGKSERVITVYVKGHPND